MTQHRTRAKPRTDDNQQNTVSTAGADELLGRIEQLQQELAAAQEQATEHLATLQRTAADFANYRRRTAEERERDLGLASESLLRKVLTIADDFDRALDALPPEQREASWTQGLVLLDRKLRSLLESEGVTPIEAAGRPFDPREHEAMAAVPGTGRPEGEVVAEIQRGYRLRDRVLRPALVAVAAASDAGGSGTPGSTGSEATPGGAPLADAQGNDKLN